MSDSAVPSACDVAIAGGGPAGAALAIFLGRAGRRVALFDKKRFPRSKPCGEFLGPECAPILAALGVDASVAAVGGAPVQGMRLFVGSRCATGRFVEVGRARPSVAHGLAVRRERFDEILLRAAEATPGVTVHEGWTVQGLMRARHGVVTGLRVRAPDGAAHGVAAGLVVGADGLRSTVAHALGVQRPIAWLDKVALTTRCSGVEPRECAEVHFVPGGYFAATTVDDGLFSLNLVLDRRALRARDGDWDAFFAAHLARAPALAARLRGARRVDPVRGCGPLAVTTTMQAVPGAALVGDACGYVDPVTGEGLFFALRGAQLLAGAAQAALAEPSAAYAALRDYERARRAEFAPRLRLALLLQRGLRHPTLVEHVMGLLQARPRLADLLVSLTGDYAPMRELLRPRVWWHALRRA
ncbi:MAG TPA: FAD-dependent monooxygenase [Planctomycetota bacterium]|nr:FAD-dependent monooxygenase [Planctomycetota bacterium]